MKRGAWVIFVGVVTILVASVMAEYREERRTYELLIMSLPDDEKS